MNGTVATYRSLPGYTGTDFLSFDVFTTNGTVVHSNFRINVI
jgi:hypothetical protein